MTNAGHTTDAPSADGSTKALADFCASLRFDDLPHAVVAKAKLCIRDTLGCSIYGATLPSVNKLAAMAADQKSGPVATVIGMALKCSPSLAALINGTSAHAFQLDEIHLELTLHPGSLAVPAALAIAEAEGHVNGRDFVAAVMAGNEVGIRIGLAAQGQMFKSGFHNQGTTGVFVAAATAARILRLSPEQTRHAFGIAGSQAAGLMAVQDGAMTKSFHCGRAAESGVYAAYLARRGYTGVPDVLDGAYGTFFASFVDQWSKAPLTEGLGSRWHTDRIGFKPAPAANGSITGMTAIDRIMREHDLKASDIDKVTAYVSDNTLHHCGWPYEPDKIQSVLSAQMSLRYGLAVMALERQAGVAQYQESKIRDPKILEFIDRIAVEHEAKFDGENGRHRVACRLVVLCRNGARHETTVLFRKGSREDPMSDAELAEKFTKLAGHLNSRQSARIVEIIGGIEKLDNIAELSRQLSFTRG